MCTAFHCFMIGRLTRNVLSIVMMDETRNGMKLYEDTMMLVLFSKDIMKSNMQSNWIDDCILWDDHVQQLCQLGQISKNVSNVRI